MKLNDRQYSVYTVWKPTRRLPCQQINNKELESMTTDNNHFQCTPSKKISDSHIRTKPRSPSLPKFRPRKPAVSPRSHSLPPKFNDKPYSNSYSSILDTSNKGVQSPIRDKLTFTPKKVKFVGKLKRKECLTTLKPMEHRLESVNRAKKEILELPSIIYKKPKKKNDNYVGSTASGNINDVSVTSSSSPSKVLCEKRKNILDSPLKTKKKLKYENHSNLFGQSKRNVESNDENNGLLRNECFILNYTGRETIPKYEKKYQNESKKENTEHKLTESRLIKDRTNQIDLSKSQRSILQYFSTE